MASRPVPHVRGFSVAPVEKISHFGSLFTLSGRRGLMTNLITQTNLRTYVLIRNGIPLATYTVLGRLKLDRYCGYGNEPTHLIRLSAITYVRDITD